MATPIRLAAALALLCAGSRARAWEPAGADIEKRVNELDKAWASLSHDATNDDIISRSKQAHRPAWAGRQAWQETIRGKNYGFGAASGPSKKKPEKRIAEAETAARAALGKMMGQDKVAAAILDWYDDSEGRFYALAAIEFAGPSAEPKKEPAAEAAELLTGGERTTRELDALGRAAIARRDFPACQARYTEAIKLAQTQKLEGPARAGLFSGMGACLAAKGNAAYARKFFERALELEPSAETRLEIEGRLKELPRTTYAP